MRKVVFIILTLILSFFAFANEQAGLMQKAEEFYKEGKYAEASDVYQKLHDAGYGSYALYYNLGNAYYKLDKIPDAILNYERALKYRPEDEDLIHNLNMAEAETLDKFENLPSLNLSKTYKTTIGKLHSNTWAVFSIVAFVFFCITLGWFLYTYSSLIKKLTLTVAVILLIFTGVCMFFSWQNKYWNQKQKAGIIFANTVTLKSSPASEATDLYVIHAGAKVNVLETEDDWLKVRLPDGNVGWLTEDNLKII